MATELPKVIVLKSSGTVLRDEGRAAEAITPGHLVNLDSNSKLIKHATAGGRAMPAFALEDGLQGKTIDDAYSANDLVFYHKAVPGEEIYAWLKDGENVAVGDYLMSAGDGTFAKWLDAEQALSGNAETITDFGNMALVQALEAVNLVGGASAAGRIKVRVI